MCWKIGLARFDCVQPRYNLLFRHIEAELLPLAIDQGIGVISYNPFAGGVLTGRYQPGQTPQEGTRFTVQNAGELYQARYWQEPQMQAVEELKAFCQEHHIIVAQLAIAWVLAQPPQKPLRSCRRQRVSLGNKTNKVVPGLNLTPMSLATILPQPRRITQTRSPDRGLWPPALPTHGRPGTNRW